MGSTFSVIRVLLWLLLGQNSSLPAGEGTIIELGVCSGALSSICPLTFILSPDGGEGRVRGIAAFGFYW
jgi:hypothetical protein